MSPRAPLAVVVAGAGAVGSIIALVLARAGARVTLADPGVVGENASGVAAGMLAPAFEALFDKGAAAHLAVLQRAQALWPKLAASIGLALGREGALAVGDRGELEAWARTGESLGVNFTLLSPRQARLRAQWLAPGLGGLWTADDWRLDPIAALAALRAANQAIGVRFAASAVIGFGPGRAVLEGGGDLAADVLVIATGASQTLADLAPELAALTPIKGHILRAPAVPLSGPVVRPKGAYICPSPRGALIGSTMEIGKADTKIDPQIVRRLISLVAPAAESLADAEVVASAGVRAATPDGLPLVGGSRAPGVWLAVGARRNGWLLAPLIAKITVAHVIGDRRDPAASLFEPARLNRP